MAKNRLYKYVLAFDPSGSFYEGKGTTGWCIMDTKTKEVLIVGAIKATDFSVPEEYWGAHLELIRTAKKTYKSLAVSVEDYLLYQDKAISQVNSRFETVQLIGIIKYYCYTNNICIRLRPAVIVKKRWTNEVLLYHNTVHMRKRKYYVKCRSEALLTHELDAIRHAIHYSYFENKED